MLLSLPLKKSTVLFIRVLKFYIFEVMFNALLLVPAIIVYITKVKVGATFYLVSILALLLIPIIPIAISCIVGGLSAILSSKAKHKNLMQIVVATIFLLAVLYFSFNTQSAFDSLANSAGNITKVMTKVYYPIALFEKLVTSFNITDLAIFIILHLAIFGLLIMLFGKLYFKINSMTKAVTKKNTRSKFVIKKRKLTWSLIKKEISKFFSIPVFVINAGFGLVLFMLVAIMIAIKFDGFLESIPKDFPIAKEQLYSYIPIITFMISSAGIFMTSITSSMISLEKKAFNTLKSLPITPTKIIMSKVMAAIIIMLPPLFIGELVLIFKFKIKITYALIILISTVVLSLLNEVIGIIINLKYPKLDAENDAEIVKQSMSSMISVFIGMGLAFVTIGITVTFTVMKLPQALTIIIVTGTYLIVYMFLMLYVRKKGKKLVQDVGV